MLWFYLALLTAILSAAFNLLSRKLAVGTENPRAFSFAFNLYAAAFALVIFLFQVKHFALPSPTTFVLLLVSVCLYGIFERVQFFARKEVNASETAILFRLSPIITFVGAILIWGEALTASKLVGFVLIIVSSFLVVYKKGTAISKGAWLVGICAVALGAARILDKGILAGGFPADVYNLIVWSAPLIIVYLPRLSIKEVRHEITAGSWKTPLTALINSVLMYTQLYALSLADASLVFPIVSASTVLTVLGGILFLGERDHIARDIIAGAIVFVGVILMR